MIRHITLANFKAFGSAQQVPLRPLTLIFGPNSGGKSSVLHSLKWAKHAVKTKSLAFESRGGSDDTPDFGGFTGAVFGKDRKRKIHFGLQLPSEHAPDYRVSFEVGLWTREQKQRVRSKPEPHNEIKGWLAAKKEFIDAEDEASRRTMNARWVVDDKGHAVLDEKGDLIEREFFGDDFSSMQEFHDCIVQEWDLRLTALWQKWHNENAKLGIRDKVDRHFERLNNYQEWLENEDNDPSVFSFEIAIGEKVLLKAERRTFEGCLHLTKVSRELPGVLQYINEDVVIEPWMDAPWVVTHPAQVLSLEDFWSDEVWSDEELNDGIGIEFQGLIPRLANSSTFSEPCDQGIESRETLESLDQLIRDCRRRLEGSIAKINYLGPLRDLPPRSLLMLGKDERLGAVADAWLRLRDDPALMNEVNQWIGKGRLDLGYRYESQVYAELSSIFESVVGEPGISSEATELRYDLSRESYKTGFEKETHYAPCPPDFWDDKEQAMLLWNTRLPRKLRDLVLHDLKNNVAVSSRDVGVGISQLIPVVIHALAEKEATIAVEQPELHLHPALQAKLGDLFIESALGPNRNQFILETHSEHLILRLLRRVRETTEGQLEAGRHPLRPEDLCILYVQPGDKGSEVIELPVTPDGDFTRPWPNGFFDERSADLF